ncbi:LysR family transcriptional regulator [Mesorhizobium sp. DCY119]|uniref:LysR family transcriptional regulator n=1 Tax=Mesorhizobium sp. DCY119 TaxID=2108445 RepID=UPI000E738AAC|nr:LysR family transcriptional regulator [Mesorhizobium sp. DCY119]RJG40910.1 LysR family transcriptional regulator [Mesorhizobium sp. DCY119]
MIKPRTVHDLAHVNLKLVSTFVCVAEFGSFQATAKAMGRSQSAISMQIKELEAQAGTQLFLRTTRHVELTAAGKMLLDQARASISGLSMTFRHIKEDIDFRRGHVRIACSPTYAAARLPYIIKAFKDAFPGVKVSIGEYKSAEILNALKQDKADFGVGPELSDPEMTFEYGRAEPLLAVVPNEWIQNGEDTGTIALDIVLSHSLVMFYPNTVVHQIISEAAEEKGLAFTVEYYCIQGETLLAFANAGIGIAILTASIADLSRVKNCKVLRIIEPELYRHFTMITRKGMTLLPAAKHLYGLISEDITNQTG